MKSITDIAADHGGVLAVKDLPGRAEYRRILGAVRRGELLRVRQGIYAEPAAMYGTMVDIGKIVPGGVVCLYNAWAHYQLSTTVPPAFCVAVDRKRKIILPECISIRLFYWKREYLDFGIVEQEVSGCRVRMTDLERSVCDAVRYRHKAGMDLCAEVVRTYLRRKDRNLTLLHDYAERLRVAATLDSFIEIALE